MYFFKKALCILLSVIEMDKMDVVITQFLMDDLKYINIRHKFSHIFTLYEPSSLASRKRKFVGLRASITAYKKQV